MHQSSLDKMKKFRDTYLDPSKALKILDVGSLDVNGTYAQLFQETNWVYHGSDMSSGKNVDIHLSNPYDWNNISDGTYDVVISGQAFEHIEYFWLTMLQISRVLKVGGLCCIIAPASGQEHRYPTDCWRYYPDGLRTLAKWAKMEVLEATTQWKSQNYPDGSDEWKDSILVCMKVVDVPKIKAMLDTLNKWIGIKTNSDIETIQNIAQTVEDFQIDKQKFLEMMQRRILSNQYVYPQWLEAILYLMKVYSERADLQNAFPNVITTGDFSDLFCWAKEFGIKEDPRLTPHANFYTNYCRPKT